MLTCNPVPKIDQASPGLKPRVQHAGREHVHFHHLGAAGAPGRKWPTSCSADSQTRHQWARDIIPQCAHGPLASAKAGRLRLPRASHPIWFHTPTILTSSPAPLHPLPPTLVPKGLIKEMQLTSNSSLNISFTFFFLN